MNPTDRELAEDVRKMEKSALIEGTYHNRLGTSETDAIRIALA
jgi:hypothetical protein